MAAARDRVAEILSVKRRGPHNTQSGQWDMWRLEREWTTVRGQATVSKDFFVIRPVTLLEVTSRRWVAQLVDFGSPYVERLADLKPVPDVKFDLTLVQAIQGRTITLGDLMAHSLTINRFGQITDIFKTLVGEHFLPSLTKAVNRGISLSDLARLGPMAKHDPAPVITDYDVIRRKLTKLFEIRHILCHELPKEPVFDDDDLDEYLAFTRQFIIAMNDALTTELFGLPPGKHGRSSGEGSAGASS